jgi:hypothetical protein
MLGDEAGLLESNRDGRIVMRILPGSQRRLRPG